MERAVEILLRLGEHGAEAAGRVRACVAQAVLDGHLARIAAYPAEEREWHEDEAALFARLKAALYA